MTISNPVFAETSANMSTHADEFVTHVVSMRSLERLADVPMTVRVVALVDFDPKEVDRNVDALANYNLSTERDGKVPPFLVVVLPRGSQPQSVILQAIDQLGEIGVAAIEIDAENAATTDDIVQSVRSYFGATATWAAERRRISPSAASSAIVATSGSVGRKHASLKSLVLGIALSLVTMVATKTKFARRLAARLHSR